MLRGDGVRLEDKSGPRKANGEAIETIQRRSPMKRWGGRRKEGGMKGEDGLFQMR